MLPLLYVTNLKNFGYSICNKGLRVCGVFIQYNNIVESGQKVIVSTAKFQTLVTMLNNLVNNTAAHNSNPGRDCVFSGAILDFKHSDSCVCTAEVNTSSICSLTSINEFM